MVKIKWDLLPKQVENRVNLCHDSTEIKRVILKVTNIINSYGYN